MKRVRDPEYFKFMVARDPWQRLTSGWNQKFQKGGETAKQYWTTHMGGAAQEMVININNMIKCVNFNPRNRMGWHLI